MQRYEIRLSCAQSNGDTSVKMIYYVAGRFYLSVLAHISLNAGMVLEICSGTASMRNVQCDQCDAAGLGNNCHLGLSSSGPWLLL